MDNQKHNPVRDFFRNTINNIGQVFHKKRSESNPDVGAAPRKAPSRPATPTFIHFSDRCPSDSDNAADKEEDKNDKFVALENQLNRTRTKFNSNETKQHLAEAIVIKNSKVKIPEVQLNKTKPSSAPRIGSPLPRRISSNLKLSDGEPLNLSGYTATHGHDHHHPENGREHRREGRNSPQNPAGLAHCEQPLVLVTGNAPRLKLKHNESPAAGAPDQHMLHPPGHVHGAETRPHKETFPPVAPQIQELEDLSCFWGEIKRSDCQHLLIHEGDYLVRAKETPEGPKGISLSILWNRSLRHLKIAEDAFGGYNLGGSSYNSIVRMLELYRLNYMCIETDKCNSKCAAAQSELPRLIRQVDRPDVLLTRDQFTTTDSTPIFQSEEHVIYKGRFRKSATKLHPGQPVQEGIEAAGKYWEILSSCVTRAETNRWVAYIRVLSSLHHPNLLLTYGIQLTDVAAGKVMLCHDYMPKGNLRNYLLGQSKTYPSRFLIKHCMEIAAGMDYMEKSAQTHGKLCASNVLVSSTGSIKIADYGRIQSHFDMLATGEKKFYPRWMAPEAIATVLKHIQQHKMDKTPAPIEHEVFERDGTIKADVWSFGVTAWEVFTMGGTPYEHHSHEGAILFIMQGYRIDPNQSIVDPELSQLAELVYSCWENLPEKRPSFQEIHEQLETAYRKITKSHG